MSRGCGNQELKLGPEERDTVTVTKKGRKVLDFLLPVLLCHQSIPT
jgi:hypothetical protein